MMMHTDEYLALRDRLSEIKRDLKSIKTGLAVITLQWILAWLIFWVRG